MEAQYIYIYIYILFFNFFVFVFSSSSSLFSKYLLLFCLGFVGFSLSLFLRFFVVDTSTTGESTSFSLVLESAFLTSTSFMWLKVFRGGCVDGFGHLKVFFTCT